MCKNTESLLGIKIFGKRVINIEPQTEVNDTELVIGEMNDFEREVYGDLDFAYFELSSYAGELQFDLISGKRLIKCLKEAFGMKFKAQAIYDYLVTIIKVRLEVIDPEIWIKDIGLRKGFKIVVIPKDLNLSTECIEKNKQEIMAEIRQLFMF